MKKTLGKKTSKDVYKEDITNNGGEVLDFTKIMKTALYMHRVHFHGGGTYGVHFMGREYRVEFVTTLVK